jgi:hypothetical protein
MIFFSFLELTSSSTLDSVHSRTSSATESERDSFSGGAILQLNQHFPTSFGSGTEGSKLAILANDRVQNGGNESATTVEEKYEILAEKVQKLSSPMREVMAELEEKIRPKSQPNTEEGIHEGIKDKMIEENIDELNEESQEMEGETKKIGKNYKTCKIYRILQVT